MATFKLTVPVTLSEYQLASICDCLNERHEFEDDDWVQLTTAEIITNAALTRYIGAQIAFHLNDYWDDGGLEFVAEGGIFGDIDQHR